MEGAQGCPWEIENTFCVMTCTKAQKVTFGTHMLSEEVEYWWENAHQRMEYLSTKFTYVVFIAKFLEKYFSDDVCYKKEIDFMELKQGSMSVWSMLLNSKS